MWILASNFMCVHLVKVCTEPKRLKRAYERGRESVRGGDSRRGRTAEQMCYKTKLKRGRDETETGEERMVGNANQK